MKNGVWLLSTVVSLSGADVHVTVRAMYGGGVEWVGWVGTEQLE